MNDAALLLIDVQKGLDDPALGERSTPEAESNIARLLATWRAAGRTVIHIRHCSVEPESKLRPELPGNAYKDVAVPRTGEVEFTKTVNSAFIGTGLEEHLRNHGVSSLVVVGLTTDHCVSTSVRMAANLGFDVSVVADATAAFERTAYDGVHYCAQDVHRVNLLSLDGEFCTVTTTTALLNE